MNRPATFCPLPWNHLATRTNGDVRICCNTGRGPEMGFLKKEDGSVYNLGRDGLFEARNARLAKEVRASMLRGERHPECIRCWQEEDAGLKSRRQDENAVYPDWESLALATAPDGAVDAVCRPVYYDLRFGNFCNLKCRTCGPQDSSAWYEDWHSVEGLDHFDDVGDRVNLVRNRRGRLVAKNNIYDWHSNEDFWTDLEVNLDTIKHVYLIGGEPLLIEAHYDFLEQAVEKGFASSMVLQYNTNLTNLHERALKLWKEFKQVRIGISLDAVGRVNDYIRHPSKWCAIERNLWRLEEALGGKAKLWFATTIGAYNIFYMDEFVEWKLTSGLQYINPVNSKRPIFNPHPVHGPVWMSYKIFPDDVKAAIAEKIRKVVPWTVQFLDDFPATFMHPERIIAHVQESVEGNIDLMMSEDRTDMLPEFWRVTRGLDRVRGESIEKSLPEFYDLIKHTER